MWSLKCKRCNQYIGDVENHKDSCRLDESKIATFVSKQQAKEVIEKQQISAEIINTLF